MSVEDLIVGKGTVARVFRVTKGQGTMGGRTVTRSAQPVYDNEPVFVDKLGGNEGNMQGREGRRLTHRLFFRSVSKGGQALAILATDEIDVQLHDGTWQTHDVDDASDPHEFGHHIEVFTIARI